MWSYVERWLRVVYARICDCFTKQKEARKCENRGEVRKWNHWQLSTFSCRNNVCVIAGDWWQSSSARRQYSNQERHWKLMVRNWKPHQKSQNQKESDAGNEKNLMMLKRRGRIVNPYVTQLKQQLYESNEQRGPCHSIRIMRAPTYV